MLVKLTAAVLAGVIVPCSSIQALEPKPTIVTKTDSKFVLKGKTHAIIARCPANTTVIGGGFKLNANIPAYFAVTMSMPDPGTPASSGPISTGGVSVLPGWWVEVRNIHSTNYTSDLTAYAICH